MTTAMVAEKAGKVEGIVKSKVAVVPAAPVAAVPLGNLEEVELSRIYLDGGNHRMKELEDAEGVTRMAESLAREGQQQPIRVTQVHPVTHNTPFRLVFGERRFTAAGKLGWKTIKAFVSGPMSDLEIESVRAIENLARRDLELAEIVRLVCKLSEVLTADGKTRGEDLSEEQVCQAIAKRLGHAVSWVRDHLRLGRFSEKSVGFRLMAEGMKQPDGAFVKLPKQHAREIAKLADPTVRDEVAEWCLTRKYNWDEVPRHIEEVRERCSELMFTLKTVPWKLDMTFAGRQACVGCPHNSKNDLKLFDGGEKSDLAAAAEGLCLNKQCFDVKRAEAERISKAEAARVAKEIKAEPKKDQKSAMNTKTLEAQAPAGLRGDSFAQQVVQQVEKKPAAAKKRLAAGDLKESPETKANRELERAMSEYGTKIFKVVLDAAYGKPGRAAATAMLGENKLVPNGYDKKIITPVVMKLLKGTKAPTIADIAAIEKDVEGSYCPVTNSLEQVSTEVLIELAATWELKVPRAPVLADFMPKAEKLLKAGPLNHACPSCKVGVGKPCLTGDLPAGVKVHASRSKLANAETAKVHPPVGKVIAANKAKGGGKTKAAAAVKGKKKQKKK